MSADRIINGVNVGASPSFPRDGLCPTCRQPFDNVEISSVRVTEFVGYERVVPTPLTGPYFTPCGHDASGCFPAAH